MTADQALHRIINGPSPNGLVGAGAVAVALILIACGLLAAGKWKRISLAVGAIAVVALMVVLSLVQLQTVTTRESESITVTRPRYPDRPRILARNTMIGMPVLIVLVTATVWGMSRRRLRLRVPHLLKAGRAHLFQKEYDPALAEFNQAIQIAPYLAEAYYGRGGVYHAIGDLVHALADFDRAIEHDPRLVAAYIQRAKIRSETGDLDGALQDFGQLLNIRSTDPELYLNRGICLFKKGQVQDAAIDFHRVLKLTNHSDFAEPAKDYLRQLEPPSESARPLLAPGANGALESPALPKPQISDFNL
jgi:tetratricopeptide (TPR) repeat protein